MLRYIVSIDYKEFTFTDRTTAIAFAELAVQNSNVLYEVNIAIKLIPNQGEKDAAHILNETEN